jgi:hypothetical protein
MSDFIDFVNRTGKNIGEVQNTQLGDFVGNHEATMRALRKKNPHKFDILYLGSLCKANGIDKEMLEKMKQKKD